MARKTSLSETWWGRRWDEVLESFGWGSRLARGRTYARGGHVLDHQVAAGLVEARVQGSRPRPYKVTIRVKTLSGEEWRKVIDALAGRAVFAARLLAGEMPRDIEEAFQEVRVSLFPAKSRDLETACTCPDWANPCKHIAAVYYILGQRFDADPFLLFQLRGQDRAELLAALHERRAGSVSREDAPDRETGEEEQPAIPADPGLFWALDPAVVRLPLHFAPPGTEAALLRRLGPPPFWWNQVKAQDWLVQCYRTVTARALADLDKL